MPVPFSVALALTFDASDFMMTFMAALVGAWCCLRRCLCKEREQWLCHDSTPPIWWGVLGQQGHPLIDIRSLLVESMRATKFTVAPQKLELMTCLSVLLALDEDLGPGLSLLERKKGGSADDYED